MGIRHSKHRKYPVQGGGATHISSPYQPHRGGFEENTITRNNPLFASGASARSGDTGYQKYGDRPAREECEDLDQAVTPPLKPEERLRRSIIRSRGHRGRRTDRVADYPNHTHRIQREEDPRDSCYRNDQADRPRAVELARSASALNTRASVHSCDGGSETADDPLTSDAAKLSRDDHVDPPADASRSHAGHVDEDAFIETRQPQENEECETPTPKPAPRTLFGMMPDVVSRSGSSSRPGTVTIEVAWRDNDIIQTYTSDGRASPVQTEAHDLNDANVNVSQTVSRDGSSAFCEAVTSDDDAPSAGELGSRLEEVSASDAEHADPTAPEVSATGGTEHDTGGMRRSVHWSDDADQLSARLEGKKGFGMVCIDGSELLPR